MLDKSPALVPDLGGDLLNILPMQLRPLIGFPDVRTLNREQDIVSYPNPD